MGATDTIGRIAASIGELNGVDPEFKASMDVPKAGVLCALPALLESGLLSSTDKHFQLPKGYYRLDSIFLLLSFLALARIKTIEDLRHCSPGEWGNILGIDRIPEAKTLREKIGILSENEKPAEWSASLSSEWMQNNPETTGVLYIDGHVRVYSGHQTKLPKHYVSRQKLCLRATTDYWVNAMDGQPFFMVTKEVDPGLLKVLEEDILPILEERVPNQPTPEELESNPYQHRFTVIFDREGYSPETFQKLQEKRIACLSYRKYPGEDWSEEEFVEQAVCMSSGNSIQMKLAERGTFLGNKLWVREIRKLSESGHQTSVISTDYVSDFQKLAGEMFSRWSQENFIKYMRQHYNIDRLVEYSTEEIPDTVKVVNPEYRRFDGEIRKKAGLFTKLQAKFGALVYLDAIDTKKIEEYQVKKASLQEEIEGMSKEIVELKAKRKLIKKNITVAELPENERFRRLRTHSKYLIDTIKMIAYRAETMMAGILRENMKHVDEARSLLCGIYQTEADILPDKEKGTLTVRLHPLANHCSSEIIRHLCSELNSTETIFPGTNLRLVYDLVSK